MNSYSIHSEEEKRQRSMDAERRWDMIWEAIRAAEAQMTVPRNSPAACIAHQNAILRRRNECPSTGDVHTS